MSIYVILKRATAAFMGVLVRVQVPHGFKNEDIEGTQQTLSRQL